jgi:hypothetical protein
VASGKDVRQFADIGFGKPLSIVIRHVYTGQFPQKRLLGGNPPMLVTSSLKDITTTSGAAQAINLLQQNVKAGSRIASPAASDSGTPLVYYSPAVASPLITASILMVFQNFDQELFNHVSQLFTSLGGIPIFMPASAYLIGAGTLLKLAGNVANAFLNGHPVLNQPMQLDFSIGGGSIPVPGFWLISENPIDVSSYVFDTNNGLTNKTTGQPYDGPEPFVLLSLDGAKQDSLAKFTPLLASASVLGQFLNQQNSTAVALDAISSSIGVANDVMFRKKADAIKQQIAALPKDSPDLPNLQKEYSAYLANIQEAVLKP